MSKRKSLGRLTSAEFGDVIAGIHGGTANESLLLSVTFGSNDGRHVVVEMDVVDAASLARSIVRNLRDRAKTLTELADEIGEVGK